MASPYLTGSPNTGGGGSPYLSGSPSTGGGGEKEKSLGHRFLADLYHAALNTPAGLYHVARAPVLDEWAWLQHPLRARQPTHSLDVGKEVAKGTAETLQHPLRHPGLTALTLLPVGEGLARVGEARAAARAGASAGEIGKVLANRAPQAARTFTHEGITVEAPASRSALGRVGQRLHGATLERAPALKVRRVRKELEKTRRVRERVERGPGVAVAALGRKLSPEQWTAMRVQAEGVKTAERIRFHQRQMADPEVKPLVVKRHQKEIKRLEGARQYLDETGKKPKISDPELRLVYEKTKGLAGAREKILEPIAPLSAEAKAGRVSAPGRVIKGAEYVKPTPGRIGQPSTALTRQRAQVARLQKLHDRALVAIQGAPEGAVRPPGFARAERLGSALSVAKDRLQSMEAAAAKRVTPTGIVGAEQFTGGEFRVPYTPKRPPRSSLRPTTSQATPPGVPRLPGSVTHQYTGGLLRSANFRPNVPEAVAESYMEAQKLAGLLRDREALKPAIQSTPTSRYHVPVRLDELGGRGLTVEERTLLDRLDSGEALTDTEQAQAAGMYEKLRGRIFPDTAKMSPEELAAHADLHAAGKIGYIDRRVLPRGLGQQVPQLNAIIGKLPAGTIDAINNATRLALFYLKPAYAIPNLLGNAALTIIQQGFAAPVNLARAARLNASLGPELAARLDELMGEGVAQAISTEYGAGSQAVQKIAGAWSHVIDKPFRRASFLHEAQRAGFKTPEQIQSLILDEHNRQALTHVTRQANEALIDYADLTPREREYVRRIVFVYPWVKGSTKYAGHFLKEHPVQAGVAGALGTQAYERNQQELGPLPSYLEGVFRVGGTQEQPLVVNPAAAALFQTPAQVAAAAGATFTGHPLRAFQSSEFASPAAQFGSDILHQRGLTHALQGAVSGTPQYLLAQRILEATHGGGTDRLYPPSIRSAIEQYLVGSLAPRTMQAGVAAEQYKREHPGHRKRKKATSSPSPYLP